MQIVGTLISYIISLKEIGEDFEEAILKCDAVLIRDSNFPVNFKKSILSKIIWIN